LHSKNIAHRDIKLQNLVYDDKVNRTKLIDFGLSKKFISDRVKAVGKAGTLMY
jgi:serine/threonine protein kinase